MRQVVFPVRGEVTVLESADPVCPEGGCLVEGRYSVISPGTELGIWTGSHPSVRAGLVWATPPYRPGSAWVGEVVQSESSEVAVGQHVLLHRPHGTHATFHPGKDFWLALEPSEALTGGLILLAVVSLVALDRCPATADDRVLVVGLGMHGQLAARLYCAAGANVVGQDLDAGRVDLARRAGIEAQQSDPHQPLDVIRIAGGPVSLIVDAAGSSKATDHVLTSSPPLARVAILGSTGQLTTDVYMGLFRRCLTVVGCHVNHYSRSSGEPGQRGEIEPAGRVLGLVRSGRLSLDGLIARTVPLSEAGQAYAGLSAGGLNGLTIALDCRS